MSRHDGIGKVQETFRSENEVVFEWRIQNIFPKFMQGSYILHSPDFSFLRTNWRLTISREGPYEAAWASIRVERKKCIPVQYALGIKIANGIEKEIVHDRIFHGFQANHIVTEFLKISELKKCEFQWNILTVTFKIQSNGPPPVEERPPSRESEMSWKAESCNNEEIQQPERPSSRESEMSCQSGSSNNEETRQPGGANCSKNCFGDLKNMPIDNIIRLYDAAVKSEFLPLKAECLEILLHSLSVYVFCDVLSLATKNKEAELLDAAIEFMSQHLPEILSTKEWESFLTENPILANEILIKAVKTPEDKKK